MRSKWRKFFRRRGTGEIKTSSNFWCFLSDDVNKTELVHFFADAVAKMATINIVTVTKKKNTFTSTSYTSISLRSCLLLLMKKLTHDYLYILILMIDTNDTNIFSNHNIPYAFPHSLEKMYLHLAKRSTFSGFLSITCHRIRENYTFTEWI